MDKVDLMLYELRLLCDARIIINTRQHGSNNRVGHNHFYQWARELGFFGWRSLLGGMS